MTKKTSSKKRPDKIYRASDVLTCYTAVFDKSEAMLVDVDVYLSFLKTLPGDTEILRLPTGD